MRRLLAAAVLLLTAGCSQTAALAPVGGDHLTEVRFAALDVLVRQQVQLLTAPVCTADSGTVTCAGDTVDGSEVRVRSGAEDPGRLTVTIAGRPVYEGSVQDVLDAAARPTG